MRIVLLNQYYQPDEAATAQLLSDVGRGLAAAGHEVIAVSSDRSYSDPAHRYPRAERLDGVRVVRCRTSGYGRASPLGRTLDYATFVGNALRVLMFIDRPDILVGLSTPPMLAVLGVFVSKLRRSRFLFWVMDVHPDVAFELGVLRRGSFTGWVLDKLARLSLRKADCVVALGETMAELLHRRSARDVVVVHNWADESTIRPRSADGHPLRQSWGWQDRFVVLYSGNMGLAHEFETVLRAARDLQKHPEVLFAFVGGGPRKAELIREAEQTGLTNVEFRPYVERSQLGDSLTAGDVHLVTLRERMPGLLVPSKIYGILAAGRPTIYVGPAEGEIHDLIEAGSCGTRIANGDVSGLAETILAYLRDTARRESEGSRAHDLFDRRFRRDKGVSTFASIVEGLAPQDR